MTKHSWKSLKDEKFTKKKQAEIAAKANKIYRELQLRQLREERDVTQVELAEILDVAQSAVSRIEKRTDMYVGTLRSYIEGMGGTLKLIASFPEEDVQITYPAE